MSGAGWGPAAGVYFGLHGSWRLQRRVDDGAVFAGVAEFRPSAGADIVYRESGCLRLVTGEELEAQRSYIFRPRAEGFAVLFNEMPPQCFHNIDLTRDAAGVLRGEAAHRCGDDLYLSDYAFPPGGWFVIRHRVAGPRKRYVMVASYARAAGDN